MFGKKKLNRANILVAIFIFLFIATNLPAQETRNLSYREFVSQVLKKDLNIQSYTLNEKIARFNIARYKSLFDPVLTSLLSKDFQKEFTGSKLQSNSSDFVINKSVDFNLSISKKFLTGANITLSFKNNRFKTNSDWALLNPMHTSSLTLNISQPLLKNFGITINRSEILKAENSLHKTELDIKDYINKEILKASIAYFELVYSYKYFQAKKEALQLAKNTLKINIKKVELGLLPKNIINESEAEVEAREEDFIKAQQAILNNEDKVKIFLNSIISEYTIKPVDFFFTEKVNIKLKDAVKYALENRYELKKLEVDIKNAKLDVLKNRNGLKPELNLNVYGAVSGKGDSFNDDMNRLKTNRYHNWGVGLQFSYPIFNRAAKADFQNSVVYSKQLEIYKKQLENSIIAEVKSSLRNLTTLRKRIKANLKALESAYEKMKTEEAKYNNKLSNVFTLFSYQTDYVNQKIKLIRAETDYSEEVLKFYKIIGKDIYKINF